VHTGVTQTSRLHHAGITSRHAHTHRLHLLALRQRDLMGSFNTPKGVLTFLSEKNNQDFVWNSGIRRSTFGPSVSLLEPNQINLSYAELHHPPL
jgi:hypothetical protein